MIDWLLQILGLKRQIANLIRQGTIKSVDLANNSVVVDFRDKTYSPKLPYLVNSSGNAKVYFVPQVGDQVIVLSPNGAIENGICIPSLYKGNVSGVSDEWRLEFAEGSITYKQGKITINANTEIDVTSPKVNVKSDNIILGDESGGGVVCQNHTCAFTGGPHPMGSTKVKGAQ